MPEIRIYGASDDLVTVEGCDGADEFNVYGEHKAPSPVMWSADLIAPGGDCVQAHAVLSDRGCWSIAVGQSDESRPFPEWPLRIEQHRSLPYTAVLIIDAPEGARLDNIWPKQEASDG